MSGDVNGDPGEGLNAVLSQRGLGLDQVTARVSEH